MQKSDCKTTEEKHARKSKTDIFFQQAEYLQEVLTKCAESPDGISILKDVLSSARSLKEQEDTVIQDAIRQSLLEKTKKEKKDALQITEAGRSEYLKNLPVEKKLSILRSAIEKISEELKKRQADIQNFFSAVKPDIPVIPQAEMENALKTMESQCKEIIHKSQYISSNQFFSISLYHCMENAHRAFNREWLARSEMEMDLRGLLSKREQEQKNELTSLQKELDALSALVRECSRILESRSHKQQQEPKIVVPTTPKAVAPTTPKVVTSTTPKAVTSTTPKAVAPTTPKVVTPTVDHDSEW